MTEAPERLAALVGSRLCHDILSPVSAIGNGLELLSLETGGTSAELQLIHQSLANAAGRLRLFRVAFGHPGEDAALGAGEVRDILRDIYGEGRLSVTYAPESDLPRSEVRLGLLVVLCLETAMPRGGEIELTRPGAAWRVTGAAARWRSGEDVWPLLDAACDLDAIAPALVHFPLAAMAAKGLGREIGVERADASLTVTA